MARTMGSLIGPVVGGGLVAAVGGSAAFAVNAGSFVVSVTLIATLRGRFRAVRRDREAGGHRDAVEGVRLLLRNPTLRAVTLGLVIVDVGNGLVLPAEMALADAFGTGAAG